MGSVKVLGMDDNVWEVSVGLDQDETGLPAEEKDRARPKVAASEFAVRDRGLDAVMGVGVSEFAGG